MITARNLSTGDEHSFTNVTPAHAVCSAYFSEKGLYSWFLDQCHDGVDWDDYVTHARYSVIKGNWCALSKEG